VPHSDSAWISLLHLSINAFRQVGHFCSIYSIYSIAIFGRNWWNCETVNFYCEMFLISSRRVYVNAAPICFRSNPLHIWLTCGEFSGSVWSSWYHHMTIYGAPCTQIVIIIVRSTDTCKPIAILLHLPPPFSANPTDSLAVVCNEQKPEYWPDVTNSRTYSSVRCYYTPRVKKTSRPTMYKLQLHVHIVHIFFQISLCTAYSKIFTNSDNHNINNILWRR